VVRLTTPKAGERHVPESWSPDGKHALRQAVSWESTDSGATPAAEAEAATPVRYVINWFEELPARVPAR